MNPSPASTVTGHLVADETALLASLVQLDGARVIELGCGKAEFARKLVERTPVASVTAFEVDAVQHRKNLESTPHPRLTFSYGGAEAIALRDQSVDGVVMMKSLHHVPMPSLDAALREVARVLKSGGWFYASEPLFAGELNEVVRLFHDEQEVRAAAYEAIKRATRTGVLREEREIHFAAPVHYKGFEQFEQNTIRATHTHHNLSAALLAEVRARFERHVTPDGAKFERPMRANLLRKD
ncbi:MAG TPA: class I SAM-dependent methyltransferase [Usitatibacter sp.]|nr:class I SAM-dependent methyltransferase [Usitatibacter sp.]